MPLPASPVLSAAPAVVIRQAAEPYVATPALTLHSASTSPSHSPRPHIPRATYYQPAATVVATPAAVLDQPHPHAYHAHAHAHLQQPHTAVAVTPRSVTAYAVPHDRQGYCEHHTPAVQYPQPAYSSVVYTQSTPVAAHSPAHHAYHTQPPAYYPHQPQPQPQVVYEAPFVATTASQAHSHMCQLVDAAMAAQQRPSLSPPLKPQPHRLTPTAPMLSLGAAGGSAFTPVQPIALYPRSGILIR